MSDDFDDDENVIQTQGVAWIVITLAMLNSYLVGAQVAAINTAALAAGQTDRFTQVMQDVAQNVRRKIQSNLRNQISLTVNSVPPELVWVACALSIEAMQSGIPGLNLSEDQRTLIGRAWNELNRIADAKDVVSIPLDPLIPEDVQRGPYAQVVSRSCDRISSRSLRGI